MKKIITVGLVLILTGCVTPITKKQEACENQFTAFADIVSCTKESFKKVKDSRVKLYFLKGDQLVEKLKKGEITELDAKTEWQSLLVQLQSRASAESAADEANYNATRVKQTHCMPVGNTVQCTTY
jgi:hypothetical protein